MPYCPDCGVELAAKATKCPLCGASAVEELPEEERISRAENSLTSTGASKWGRQAAESLRGPESGANKGADFTGLREGNTLRWEMLSVSVLISAIAVSAVNLLTSDRLSWALYPLLSLAFLWLVSSALIELRRLPALGLPLAFIALPLFLFALDLVDGTIDWAWPVGIPIALIAEISFGLVLLISARLHWKPLLTLSLIILAVTLSCLGIDGSLSASLSGHLRLRWSAIVAAALIPVSIFLAYVHFRIPHVARLNRLFHL